jgi:hypothetical protein
MRRTQQYWGYELRRREKEEVPAIWPELQTDGVKVVGVRIAYRIAAIHKEAEK